MRIPVDDCLDSQGVELSPDGRHILWCFAQEPASEKPSGIDYKRKIYTFWVSGYLGENLHQIGSMEAHRESETPEKILWCIDSRHASFVWKNAVWKFVAN